MSLDDITQIAVDGLKVGINGLNGAIEAVRPLAGQPDDIIAQALLEHLKQKNYIPAVAQESYKRAFLREFKQAQGEAVEEERSGVCVKILGPGCPSCRALEQLVMTVAAELLIPADIEHVTDRKAIAALGVFATPALLINDEVKAVGKAPSKAMLEVWLREAATAD